MLRLSDLDILESKDVLKDIPEGKKLINTINAHSFNTAQNDELFAEALKCSDYLIPDGASIVKACRWLGCKSQPKERVAGWDLFEFEMCRLNGKGGRCMFMGSSPKVLGLIVERAREVYPNIEVVTYSPPYKSEFTEEDNKAIIAAINIHCHVGTIGAVFDFFAGTYQRAPRWWQEHSLEWLYRLIKEPKRMWRRYVVGNPLFLLNIHKEKSNK